MSEDEPDRQPDEFERMAAPLRSLAERLTDDSGVDWETELRRSPELSSQVESFRIIDSVAQAHRSAKVDSTSATTLFCWGPLQVLEELGQGGFGVVYRAFDPRLRREVALKLRRPDAPGSARRWLDEARNLARVRHEHVLVVHGADVYEERAGIWFDLIRGKTLERLLEEQGPFGAREAASIGVELCQALAAVHAEGMVHGDVKAANVMREAGGRLVLMDFGSVHEIAGVFGTTTTTPLSCAPELLSGGKSTPAADVYSMGVLLYRLATGRYPIQATTMEELRQALLGGEFTPLRSLRPDLPSFLVTAVERAIAVKVEDRWSSVAELERALAEPGVVEARPLAIPRSTWIGLAAVVLVLLLAVQFWRRGPDPSSGAAAPVQLECALLRVTQNAREPLDDGDSVQPGEHLALELRSDESLYVYVLNEDEQGEIFVLFPVVGSQLENPLAAGISHRLPGELAGTSFDWVVTSAGGREHFLTVASRRPLQVLEAQLRDMQSTSAARPIEYARLSENDVRALRGVGGMLPTPVSAADAPSGQLQGLAHALGEAAAELGGVWIRLTTLQNPGL